MKRNAPSGLFTPDPRTYAFSLEEALLDLGADSLDGIQEVIAEMDDGPELTPETVISEEGIGTDIRNGFDDLFQYQVLHWKHFRDVQNDFFSETNPKIARYNQKLNETWREFQEKKHKFRDGEHHLSLMELWYFFSNKQGASRNVIRDLQQDTEFSKFVLVTYRKAVIDQLSALASIVQGARLHSLADCHKVIEAIQRLKTIDELFDDKWLGEGRYFNVTSVIKSAGSVGKDFEFDGKSYSRATELSSGARVVEKKSKGHTAMKVVANVTNIGAAIKGSSIAPMEISTNEIGEIIMFGKDYVANLDTGLELSNSAERATNALMRGVEAMRGSSHIPADDIPELRKFVKFVGQVADSYIAALKQPFGAEVIRSIKGAKYCYYIGLRCIYNASKYI